MRFSIAILLSALLASSAFAQSPEADDLGCSETLPSIEDILAIELPEADTIATLFDLAELASQCGRETAATDSDGAALERLTLDSVSAEHLAVFTEAMFRLANRGDIDGLRDIFFALDNWARAGGMPAAEWLEVAEQALVAELALLPDGEASELTPSLVRIRRNAEDEANTRDLIVGEPDHVIVPVFYGTNRARTGEESPLEFYGRDRAPIELGVVSVSVPRNRDIGEIRRTDRWRGDLTRLRGRYFIIESVRPFETEDEFTSEMRQRMDESQRRELLVYIHGYNTDFRSAAERAAQLAVDLEIDGAPAMYSWPSRGTTLGYFADANQVIRPAINDLQDYLELLIEQSGADRIHLVAHSMGNRFLLRALEEIAEDNPEPLDRPLFDQVVWASPDVDQEDFLYSIPELLHLANDMTLYASASDRALRLSRRIQGGYPRAGDVNPAPVVVDGLYTVDTTAAGDSGLGHSDYAGPALDDFRAIVWHSLSPDDRCILEVAVAETGLFHRVDPDDGAACEPEVFKYSITALRRAGPNEAMNAVMASIDDQPDSIIVDQIDAISRYLNRIVGGQ